MASGCNSPAAALTVLMHVTNNPAGWWRTLYRSLLSLPYEYRQTSFVIAFSLYVLTLSMNQVYHNYMYIQLK